MVTLSISKSKSGSGSGSTKNERDFDPDTDSDFDFDSMDATRGSCKTPTARRGRLALPVEFDCKKVGRTFRGFPPTRGPGAGRSASHGGGAAAYGNLPEPTALGSGSDTQYGGGAIALLATGTITVNGTISADGIGDYNRASAGGSVWLQCDTLAGSAGGVIRAQGGGYAGRIWGGGGCRISLDYQTRTYAGTVTAPGGGNSNWQILEGGGLRRQAGTLWEPNREFPRSGGTVAQWGPRVFAWCDAAGDANGGELANEAVYTLRGLSAGQKAAVWVNNAFYDTLTADGQGALTLAAVALAPDASLRVEISAGGTLLLFR